MPDEIQCARFVLKKHMRNEMSGNISEIGEDGLLILFPQCLIAFKERS